MIVITCNDWFVGTARTTSAACLKIMRHGESIGMIHRGTVDGCILFEAGENHDHETWADEHYYKLNFVSDMPSGSIVAVIPPHVTNQDEALILPLDAAARFNLGILDYDFGLVE